jgi:hypothetical protein
MQMPDYFQLGLVQTGQPYNWSSWAPDAMLIVSLARPGLDYCAPHRHAMPLPCSISSI